MNTETVNTGKYLQTQFEKETGTKAINSQYEFDIDYVAWLEKKVAAPQPQEKSGKVGEFADIAPQVGAGFKI